MGFEGILVVFRFWEVFWSFFGFQGYFGHFMGFMGILVMFWALGVFWSFFGFQEYFGHFLGLGVFWSFSRNLDFMLFI